ncbi:MAG: alpha/beta hydrolase [Cellvibrio sp.]|uniref:alpha/beta fold hydrolase n=1 Tax=Cellvibrio sp. TaxID=1965322 RepID=UPI0031A2402C
MEKKITLVLLPGLNGTAGLFDPLLAVATDEYELLVISYPTHEVKSYEELTEYVLGKISSIDGRFVLVGESFSGPIAIFILAKNITNHIGTILVASFESAPYFTFTKYLPWTFIFSVAPMLYWLRIKLSDKNTSSILKAASIELQKIKPQVLAARVRSALSVDAREALGRSAVPIIYLRAKYDIVVPKWNLSRMLALNPKITVITFPVQHFLLQSTPAEAWRAIDTFVKETTHTDFYSVSNA